MAKCVRVETTSTENSSAATQGWKTQAGKITSEQGWKMQGRKNQVWNYGGRDTVTYTCLYLSRSSSPI